MFERFTDKARRVVVLAQEEARRLGHGRVGTEHILLGLTLQTDGTAAQTLAAQDIGYDQVRAAVEEVVEVGTSAPKGHFTGDGKQVLEQSLRAALALRHNYIGTEHLLLGLLRLPDSTGAQVLLSLGVDRDALRATVEEAGREPRNPTDP